MWQFARNLMRLKSLVYLCWIVYAFSFVWTLNYDKLFAQISRAWLLGELLDLIVILYEQRPNHRQNDPLNHNYTSHPCGTHLKRIDSCSSHSQFFQTVGGISETKGYAPLMAPTHHNVESLSVINTDYFILCAISESSKLALGIDWHIY